MLVGILGLFSTLLLDVGSLVLDVLFHGLLFGSTGDGSVGVQLVHSSLVLERVLLLGVVDVLHGGSDNGLDFVGVDDTVDISNSDNVLRKGVVLLLGSLFGDRAVDSVEVLEGVLGPDDETTDMTTRSETEEVETSDVAEFDTGEVSEGLSDTFFTIVVDNHGTETSDVTAISQLAHTTADVLGGSDLFDIGVATALLQEGDGFLGLLHVAEFVSNNEGDFTDFVDLVTAGHDEGGDGRGSDGGDESISLLVEIDLAMPLSPDLGGSEHTTLATHVSEGTLAGSGGTTTRNTRNTGNSSTSTPGDGGVLVTGTLEDGVSLTVVLVHATDYANERSFLLGVDELNNIGTDGSGENSRKSNGGVHLISIFNRVDRDDGTSSLWVMQFQTIHTILISLKENVSFMV